ncbi:MAG: cupin domain-containing protein [Balneolaceae bacterium]|nr:cupin domain-containing protein [Balneolaceae bacterium]
MNQGHIKAGEVVNLHTLKSDMSADSSYALIKTPDMEVIRMVVPEGREIEEHKVEGEVSVQCLKGKVAFSIGDETRTMTEGSWLYLNKKEPHSLTAKTDSVLLVTILFVSNS